MNLQRALVATVLMTSTVACGTNDSPQTAPSVTDVANLLWETRLDHRGAVMAVGQNLQLHARALNPLGVELPDVSANIVYTTTDTARALVSPTGLVTARAAGNGIFIIAKGYSSALDMTTADTLRLNVTASVVPITSFTIQPDSTLIGGDEQLTLVPRAIGPGGPADNLSVLYSAENSAALSVNATNGTVSANYLGSYKVWASTTIYGTVWTDTVRFTVTRPVWARVLITNLTYNDASTPLYAQPFTLTVRKHATVRFQMSGPMTVPVTFDNPGAVVGGNIAALANGFQERQFPNTGTYIVKVGSMQKDVVITVVD